MKHEIQLGRSVLLHVVACVVDELDSAPQDQVVEPSSLIAEYVSRFRGPHSGSLDDETSRDDLCCLIGRLPA
jgi:hypothetical protein